MRIVYKSWIANAFLPKKIKAITLCGVILFKDAEDKVSRELLLHELRHAQQIQQVGCVNFYRKYMQEYIANLFRTRDFYRSYREISYEKDATQFAREQIKKEKKEKKSNE